MPTGKVTCTGLVERIGLDNALIHLTVGEQKFTEMLDIPDHTTGLEAVSRLLTDPEKGVITSTDEIEAVGHRVVHGGSTCSDTSEITHEAKEEIRHLSSLAPLHNPPNLAGIEVAEKVFDHAKQVAVFDTAFHQTIPARAHRYAVPEELYEKEKIRLYGFHGTSHKYVSERANEFLNTSNSKIITIHLGNGCSMTAVQDGKSVDHSLGFSPVTGLIMGTRSGDIDPAIVFYLVNELDYKLDEVNTLLQKKSGLLGITGFSDLREIEERAASGDEACQLGLEMKTYRIKKYIGAYAAVMNGLDAIVFTGGIGENSETVRKLVCNEMDYLGINLDREKNAIRSKETRDISTADSRVKVLVIPTNEELEIARQAYYLLEK